MVIESDLFLAVMYSALFASMFVFGPLLVIKAYWVPYVVFVVWLDTVTYLHHHGAHNPKEKMPWYRGKEWNYLRGGLTTIDRDYGVFNKIHHDIGTHVVHHLFPQIPHYNLEEATEALKPMLGPYYRVPEKSPGPLPLHLVSILARSFEKDQYVPDKGDVVFYSSQTEEAAAAGKVKAN